MKGKVSRPLGGLAVFRKVLLFTGFWMLYGTPYVHGKPFIWSQSLWNEQKLRDVPDRIDGLFTLMPLYLR